MARSFPPDVLVLDSDSLVHARVGRGRKQPQILQAKSYRIADDVFTPAIVTPDVANETALGETLRRLRMETGRWDKASVLLPDGWFRINILELPNLPEKRSEADQVIRWSLKRTMPIAPESLRIAWEILARSSSGVKILAVSAVDKTLATLERLFAAAGIDVVTIEPVGLNIWNAIAVREESTTADRLFLYLRDTDFTTAVFRGAQPLFIRSRNLTGDRTVEQEIRLSASYLRDTLRMERLEHCYVAGNGVGREVASIIGDEFGAPVRMIALRDVTEQTPGDVGAYEAELTACTGVFTG
jgi:hypothetical protein